MPRILIVEDEPDIALVLEDDLVTEGYEVEVAADGTTGSRRAREASWDLVLLDVMLPGKDGFEVCRELRRNGIDTPIILLTARAQEAEKVLGLELGADDYVTKPFSPRELRARIKAVLRRKAPISGERYQFGEIDVDFARAEVKRGGERIDLTAIELKLLAAFIDRRGRPEPRAAARCRLGRRRARHRPRGGRAHRQPAPQDRAVAGRTAVSGQRSRTWLPLRWVNHDALLTESSPCARFRLAPGVQTAGMEAQMRVLFRVIVLAAPLLAAVSLTAQSLDVELQRAVQREIASGDVKRAIQEYRRIADRAGSNRAVAAQALLRLAEAHQKLGDAEANKVYEQIVAKYSDQADVARTARGRLAAGGASATGGMALRRVWSGPDVERSANVGRVSPEGRYLAFPANLSHELIVREVATGAERALVQLKDAIFWQPLWYPDGRRLAFVVEHQRSDLELPFEIRVVNLDGSGMRTIMRNRTDMGLQDWSKDGSRILAMMDDPDGETEPGDCRGCTDGFRLFWVDAANGNTTTLATGKWNGRFEARLSPDGRYVAFGAVQGSTGREIRLVAADGTRETRLSTNPQDYYPVTWAPDGMHVVVTSMRGPVFALWALPVANGKLAAEPAMISRELCTGCTVINPWGSTRAGAFYYSAPTFASEIRTASLDPQSGKAISPPVALSASRSGFNVLPRWSPDGRRILYQWGTANTRQRILTIASADGTSEQRLDWLKDFPGGYCWSGNDSILVRKNTATGWALYRVDLATHEETLLFEESGPVLANMSCPEGSDLVAYTPNANYLANLRIRNLQTGQVIDKELPPQTRRVQLSPDGRRLALEGDGPNGIYVMDVDGDSRRQLLQVGPLEQLQRNTGFVWSPDSRYLYFSRRERLQTGIADYNFHVFRVPLAGGKAEAIGLSGRDLRDLRISPDGRRIAFSVGDLNRPEVWAIENFLPGAK